MLENVLFVAAGIACLFFGGNQLVQAATRLALSFGASVLIVGLTVVAWGTSSPELIVSASAALQGSSDIAIGNVVGSNIVNIGLILGLSAFIFPVKVDPALVRREMPIMIAVAVLSFLLAFDGVVSRLDGVILFGTFIAYNAMVFYLVRTGSESSDKDKLEDVELPAVISLPLEVGRLIAALIILIIGAQLTLTGSVALARTFGISELVIGVTLVAAGTSLPELATSMVAAWRKASDIAIGNVIGSNIANIVAILGLTAIIQPVNVAPEMNSMQYPIMLAFSVALLLLSLRGTIGRVTGGLIVLAYVSYIILTFTTSA